MSDPIIVPLSKAITAHGESVDELRFRPPTTEEYMQYGTPTLLIPSADGESVGVEIRAKVIGQYISRLASIPLSSVKALDIPDFMRCQGAVMSFFSGGDGEA